MKYNETSVCRQETTIDQLIATAAFMRQSDLPSNVPKQLYSFKQKILGAYLNGRTPLKWILVIPQQVNKQFKNIKILNIRWQKSSFSSKCV